MWNRGNDRRPLVPSVRSFGGERTHCHSIFSRLMLVGSLSVSTMQLQHQQGVVFQARLEDYRSAQYEGNFGREDTVYEVSCIRVILKARLEDRLHKILHIRIGLTLES